MQFIRYSRAGSIHEAQKEVLKELLAKGLKVAVSSRVVAGRVARRIKNYA
ncbi:hypothetical protein [Campylobacter upsaliensis]